MIYDLDEDATVFPDDRKDDMTDIGPADKPDGSKRVQKQDSNWKSAAIGAGAGLVIGGISPFLMGMAHADSGSTPDDPTNRSTLSHPEWVDDKIKVATNVEESMNFSEAFATARAEVGPGGCFEWHGKVYSTYLAEEWKAMTPEERSEFNNHFSWNHIDRSHSHVNPPTSVDTTHDHGANESDETPPDESLHASNETPTDESLHASNETTNDESLHASNETTNEQEAHDLTEGHGVEQRTIEVLEATASTPEIEILGISHDAESGANVGSVMMDGQEIILIDVDGDMDFDYLALNSENGAATDTDNIIDIQDHNLSVNDLGGLDGLSDPSGFDSITDYSNDNC